MTYREKIEFDRRNTHPNQGVADAPDRVNPTIDYKNKNFVKAQQSMSQCIIEMRVRAQMMTVDAENSLAEYNACLKEADEALELRENETEMEAKLMEAAAHKDAFNMYTRMASQLRQFAQRAEMDLKVSEVTRTTQTMTDNLVAMLRTYNPKQLEASMGEFSAAFGQSSHNTSLVQGALSAQTSGQMNAKASTASTFDELKKKAMDRASVRNSEKMHKTIAKEMARTTGASAETAGVGIMLSIEDDDEDDGETDEDMKRLRMRFRQLKN